MDRLGIEINPHIERLPMLERQLLRMFKSQWPDMILSCIEDDTKRHNLVIRINTNGMLLSYGFQANYSKKERRFTFLQYTYMGHAKRIAV